MTSSPLVPADLKSILLDDNG